MSSYQNFQISDIELRLMYALKFNIKINWALMIMRQMWTIGGTRSPLSYAIFITNILQHFGVSTNSETKMPLNLRESQIDVEVIHKMGFTQHPRTRTYKHRTNKPTAAANPSEPEPPNPPEPQPSEFHAQSSSSAAMPTNQMIMDELFSLQGYITNQMDALDSQHQQIQYELHCLSSRMDSMDINEDNLESDS
ncbi:hypothetical protein TanjilG_20890 [Lupinus angustifolius]|uniref:Uncharacterized protein n=1 Tax=Lupinus angustifolius TaxID=3871 RepID=A0A1J7HEV0_LUPAN|nr:hypothetical protein TanjilG_20890 [Lupinus angustifolius]